MLDFICLCLVRCAPLCHNILWWSDVAVISLHCWNETRVRKTGSILFALLSHLCKSFTSHPLCSTTFARHLNLISYKVFLMPLECIVLLCHTFLPGLSGLCKPRYWVPVLRCTLCGWQSVLFICCVEICWQLKQLHFIFLAHIAHIVQATPKYK